MKKILYILPIISFSLFLAFSPGRVFAAFDPGFVFPDPVLTSKDTMNEAQIQAFLVSKGSFLANYTMPANRQVPYPCNLDGDNIKEATCQTWLNTVGWNNDIDVSGWSSAKVIYNAAQWYGVNPQLIITTLQKEQSSITYKTLGWNGQIDWATGYGVPDGSGADYHYYGFAKQVDMATWQLRWVFEGSGGNTGWYPPLSYGGSEWDIGKTVSWPRGIWETWDGANVGPCVTTTITSRVASALYKHNPYRVNKAGLYSIYYNWFDPADALVSNVPITVSLGFSNLTPIAGETLSVGFALKNTSESEMTVDVGLADQNTTTGQWNSFSPQYGQVLAPGESRYLYFSKQVLYPGSHRTWIALGYKGTWYDAKPLSNQLVRYNYYVSPPDNLVTVSASLGFSDLFPVLGETLTAVYTLKNNSKSEVSIDAGLADINRGTGQWNSFSPQKITVAGDSERQVVFSKMVLYPGQHTSWIAIGVGGLWYDAIPVENQLTRYPYEVRVPNIRLNSYAFDVLPPKANQKFNGLLSVTNLEPNTIVIDSMGVPIYNHTAGTWNTMLYSQSNVSVAPNQTYNFTVYQTLAGGYYSIWPSACTAGYCFTPKTASGIEMFWTGSIL